MLVYRKNLKIYSVELRKNMTDAEIRLWAKIRNRQLVGLQFYRQKIIVDYVVDFYCPGTKLVIEVDGGQHYFNTSVDKDRIRDDYLKKQGLRVLRFTNTDILGNIEGVIENILEVLNSTDGKIPLSPLFQRGIVKHPLFRV